MKPNLIAGEWRDSTQATANINPSDLSDIIGEYAAAGPQEVKDAIAGARSAFPAWSTASPQVRSDILDAAGQLILARKAELGDLLAREEGKTLPEATGEVVRAAQIFKFFAGEALRQTGDVVDSVRPGVKVEVTREAVGVVAAITPWNFPIAIPAWKIAPALAFGNCAILKPAELTPGCAHALAEILVEAGVPDGVFSLVMGPGRVVGQALADSDGIDAMSFTGSVPTGAQVRDTVTARGGRVQLEMGGKNPLIILDDADLDLAVNCAVQGAFYSTGQRCTASSRLIVTPGIADRFVTALADATRALRVGDARQADTQIGPLASGEQMAKQIEYTTIGRDEGARLVCGGEALRLDRDGYYFAPTLFDDTAPAMRINREEVFGPFATIQRADDYDHALALANDTEFGLSAGICTGSLKHAEHFKRHIQAGMSMVNLPTAGVDYHVPFGGRKASSHGPREQGRLARDFYTVVKTNYQFAG